MGDYNTSMNMLFFAGFTVMLLTFIAINIFVLRSQRKAMESIEQTKNEAEMINRSLSNLITIMSHEPRISMNEILEIAQVQLQRKELPDDYLTALEIYAVPPRLLIGYLLTTVYNYANGGLITLVPGKVSASGRPIKAVSAAEFERLKRDGIDPSGLRDELAKRGFSVKPTKKPVKRGASKTIAKSTAKKSVKRKAVAVAASGKIAKKRGKR